MLVRCGDARREVRRAAALAHTRRRSRALMLVALLGATPSLGAQHVGMEHDDPAARWTLGAMAIGVATRVDPASRGIARSEGYLTQPMVMARGASANGRLWGVATINFEGLTLRRGELSPGVYGEGYVDRRHPHTYSHELMLGALANVGSVNFSLAGGKGFAPFGTDDPMARPLVKYPANHHLAQILERLTLIGAVRRGPLVLEGALFNGDEPEAASDWPNSSRFGDSWSARATLFAAAGLELQVSYASVASPEDAGGDGLDQRKRSASVRWELAGTSGMSRTTSSTVRRGLQYALIEVADSDEYDDGRKAFSFSSALAEASGMIGPLAVAARIERTIRPEEERSVSDFRTVRPLLDFNIIGRTRWDLVSIAVGAPLLRTRSLRFAPFVETTYGRPRAVRRPAVFDPEVFYGASGVWSLSAGVRLHGGTMRARMGRYGVALSPRSSMQH